MNLISAGLIRVKQGLVTVFSKLRWGRALSVSGLFKKRNDTQIIISGGGKMVLKRGVSFKRNVSLTATAGGVLQIGEGVSFNRNCIVICRNEIRIEDGTIFGPNVAVYDHDHVYSKEGILPGYKNGSVVIEKGCWIGAGAIILRNTHIGEGCVIGAGTVVKGDIPAHSLVTGERKVTIAPIES